MPSSRSRSGLDGAGIDCCSSSLTDRVLGTRIACRAGPAESWASSRRSLSDQSPFPSESSIVTVLRRGQLSWVRGQGSSMDGPLSVG